MASRRQFNAKDFGVKGNGSTNDTTALGALFTAAQAGSVSIGSQVAEIVVTYGGSGYSGTPTVSVSVGSGITATAVVKDQKVQSIYVTANGTGYTGASVVTFSGGGGTGASAYAIIGNGADIIIPPGSYYLPDGITMSQLHNVRVTAFGASIKRDATSTQPGLWVQGTCRRVTIEGLALPGTSADRNGTYGVGILGQGDDLRFNRCQVTKWPNFAFQFYGDTSTESRYFSGPTVDGCEVSNTFADGIHVGHGFIGTRILNNRILNTEEEDAIAFYNDFEHNLLSRDSLVSGNIIQDARWRGILVAGVFDINVIGNVIDGTASHGISGDDGGTSGSITLSLTNGLLTATVTSGTPFIGAYIYGTGLSLPAIITDVVGSTVTFNQAANSTSSESFNQFQGMLRANISGNTISRVGAVTKNAGVYTARHGVYVNYGSRVNVSNNLVSSVVLASSYAVRVDETCEVWISSNAGFDMVSGTTTVAFGANVFGSRALYDDAGALKYRGTSATVTNVGPA